VALGENATYLKLEKPYFLFLEGSEGAAAEPVAATAALADAPAALAGAPTVRAASSTDHPAAGASTPAAGACSSAASAALGDGGGGFHLSGGAPPSLSSSSSSSSYSSSSSSDDNNDDEFSGVVRGESPCCSRSWYSSLCFSRCSRCRILLSFLHGPLLPRRYTARVTARARGVCGSDREASTVTLC
jgi:hypothetical protein